ncbi:MAG: hypothetical protein HW396_76 [Candidatus Dadabacteria bacterium]|nr:hypothetical protein [Candidatus Dadabacteria bacterium]OGE24217.1 MAG: hypothetical protein A2V51_04510 [Candidatus Dadabacteria bacterium RBG_19FT_COMBO_40_33]
MGESGLHIKTFRKPEWLTNIPELSSDEGDTHLSSNINVDLLLTKVLKEISVRGNIWFSIETPCARCLDTMDLILEPEVNLILLPEYLPHEKDEDIDFETYKGDEIDLGGYLRELIAMSLPIKVLCVEECKGLCPNCGVNLNLEECSCKDNWVDPRFAVLRNLKV